MEGAGLRARIAIPYDSAHDCETVCEKRLKSSFSSSWSWLPLRLTRTMPTWRGYSLLTALLGVSCTLTLIHLVCRTGRPGKVGLWAEGQEEEWKLRVGDRLKEKLERAREGEKHHVLDHEEEHWMQMSGIQIHHDPDQKAHLPPGEVLNIAVSLPFLDKQPLAAESYMKMLEWITIYSSVPIHFFVVTNSESSPLVDRVMEQVNYTSNCNFDFSILSFDKIIEETQATLCPELAVSEEFCDLLMGNLTPLLFPFLFPQLPYIIYIDKHITFHDDVGKLYNSFLKLSKEESLAMVQEQSLRYMRAFGTHQIKQPATKLGKPPSKGHPGYNPDLMVMDLAKLRGDKEYKANLTELKLSLLLRKYSYHPDHKLPTLGDVLNLFAAERPQLFHQLPCEWNKSAEKGTDPLLAEFLDCLQPDSKPVRATNFNPNTGKARK